MESSNFLKLQLSLDFGPHSMSSAVNTSKSTDGHIGSSS